MPQVPEYLEKGSPHSSSVRRFRLQIMGFHVQAPNARGPCLISRFRLLSTYVILSEMATIKCKSAPTSARNLTNCSLQTDQPAPSSLMLRGGFASSYSCSLVCAMSATLALSRALMVSPGEGHCHFSSSALRYTLFATSFFTLKYQAGPIISCTGSRLAFDVHFTGSRLELRPLFFSLFISLFIPRLVRLGGVYSTKSAPWSRLQDPHPKTYFGQICFAVCIHMLLLTVPTERACL